MKFKIVSAFLIWIHLLTIIIYNSIHFFYASRGGGGLDAEMFSYGLYGSFTINGLALVLSVLLFYFLLKTTFDIRGKWMLFFAAIFLVLEISAYVISKDGLILSFFRSLTLGQEYYFGNLLMILSIVSSMIAVYWYARKKGLGLG